jgi:hypothetical protein
VAPSVPGIVIQARQGAPAAGVTAEEAGREAAEEAVEVAGVVAAGEDRDDLTIKTC